MHKMRTEQSPLLHLSHFYITKVTTQTTFSHDTVNITQQSTFVESLFPYVMLIWQRSDEGWVCAWFSYNTLL